MASYKFTNRSAGPRYVHTANGPVVVNPGETSEEVEISDAELKEMRAYKDAGSSRNVWQVNAPDEGERQKVFLVLADDSKGGGMQFIDLGNARYFGAFKGTTAPADPEAYNLQAILEGDEDDEDADTSGAPTPEGVQVPSKSQVASMTKAQLQSLASTMNLQIPDDATNADIVDLIEASRGQH